jgi:hypothetical protein
VTETNVIGTYTDSNGKMIILNSDKTSKIEVEVVDTVLTVFRNYKEINGQWNLNKNMLVFNITDTKYKYLENNYYEVSRSLFRKPLIWNWGPGKDKSNFNRFNKTK